MQNCKMDPQENEMGGVNGEGGMNPAAGGGGGEARWDEDSYEDPTQMIMEIGDLPQMERVQEALYQQLMRDHERVALELRENTEEMKKAKQRREDMGVDLYGVQTQLAKLQMAVETSHNQKNMIAEYRAKAEEDLANAREDFKMSKNALIEHKKQMYKNQAELDALSATLRQVELYNEEMKSEIAVTRRATYKAEENLSNMEKDKTSQDLYIDQLNENAKELHNRLALLEAQLQSQKNETQVIQYDYTIVYSTYAYVRTPSSFVLKMTRFIPFAYNRLRTKHFGRPVRRWKVFCLRKNNLCSSGRVL